MAMTAYDEVTRADMAGFDKECIDLALEAQSLGWTGKMSSKGHMIMRAPDGMTTMSISRRWGSGRSGANMRANFDRWLRNHTIGSIDVSFQDFSAAWDAVEQERFIEVMIQGLSDAADEFGGDDAERTKVIYRNILEAPKVGPFAWRVTQESRITDFGILIGYSDAIAEEDRRPWNVNWAVYDRRSMEVIDHGGPRLMDGKPWDEEFISLLVIEKVRRERDEEAAAQEEALSVEMDETLTIVVDDRPFKCEWCGRGFFNNTNLGRHKSTIHRDLWLGEVTFDEAEEQDPHDEDGNRLTPAEPVSNPIGQEVGVAQSTADAMGEAIDRLSIVAQRMAFLEAERGEYEATLSAIRAGYEEQIVTLTQQRDNAQQSLNALKQIVSDL